MVLIEGFRATNVWKAFVLNSIVASLVIFIALFVKGKLDRYRTASSKHSDSKVTRTTTWQSVVVTISVTFVASFIAYVVMYFTFGYGRGMLVCN